MPPTPQTEPQQLQFTTETPLNEQTNYGFFLTAALQDERGKKVIAAPAFALMRMESPLVDGDGVSQVSGVPDASAQALEPLRQGHKAFIDALVASGVERKDLALAWTVRTQSTVSLLELLHDSGARDDVAHQPGVVRGPDHRRSSATRSPRSSRPSARSSRARSSSPGCSPAFRAR